MTEAVLSLGSNEGRREANIARAVGLLSRAVSVEEVSSLYETEPMYLEAQPWFLNCVLVVRTDLSPRELLRATQEVEEAMGRRRRTRYGPRVIDVDIVFYGSLVVSEPGLEIPHPRVAERLFVLAPLAEVRPGLVHPLLGKTVSELVRAAKPGKAVRKVGEVAGFGE